MIGDLNRLLQPLYRRVRLMIGRCVVKMVEDGDMQMVQVSLLAGEVRGPVEHFQMFGCTSRPLGNAEGVYLSVGGDRDTGIVVCIDDRRYRMKGLKDGEMAIYNADDKNSEDGCHIILKRGGLIEARGTDIDFLAGKKLRLAGDTVQIHAKTLYRFDCNGQGQKWDGHGVETFQDDDVARPHHPHAPPEIPD